MRALRVYVDTSVLGGYFDPEFAVWSKALIENFRLGRLRAVLSDVTAAEVAPAPEHVRELHAELITLGAEVAPLTAEGLALVASYRARGVLGVRFENDMRHIAVATVTEVDVLVSWNFRHIVRLDRIRLFNAVNLETGYKPLTIYSPREVASYGTGEE